MNRQTFIDDMVTLVGALRDSIADDYRASGSEDDDDTPSMDLTIGADASGWSYQTGDNSYTGGAYGFPHWAVIYLTRDSDLVDTAVDIIGQLLDVSEFAETAIFDEPGIES